MERDPLMENRYHYKQNIIYLAKVCILVVFAFWGCQKEEQIRIGLLVGISGRVADTGISGRDAAQLAIEQCNQNGGLFGRNVELTLKDDQNRPEIAQQAVREFIKEKVAAIVGPVTSNIALAITPITNAEKILLLSPTVAGDSFSGKDDYFLRLAPATRVYAEKTAAFLIKSSRLRLVVAVYDSSNPAFTESWLKNFKVRFEGLGGEVIASIGFNTQNDQTFLDIAKEALFSKPDGVLIIANSMDSGLLCQQIRKLDGQAKIVLSDWGATERLLELGGNAVEGAIVVQGFNRQSQNPRYQAFRKTFLERYHQEPSHTAVNTFNAIGVILTAIRSKGNDQTLRDTILSTEKFEGLQGDFRFDPFGDIQSPQVSISTIRDRQFTFLE
jgi:branched-chain amino acid transport system substrate-binding protein